MTDEQLAESIYKAVHPGRSFRLKQAGVKDQYLKIARWHNGQQNALRGACERLVKATRTFVDSEDDGQFGCREWDDLKKSLVTTEKVLK
jgi:hypothetical protein